MRTKLFSITIADCEVQTFAVGGHGGAGKDTSNSGVRIVHPPSGASGEGRESRSQLQNKRAAFKRMANSTQFREWVRAEARRLEGKQSIEQQVEQALQPHNLKVEVRNAQGQWEPSV
jgi:protein subunit release factor A